MYIDKTCGKFDIDKYAFTFFAFPVNISSVWATTLWRSYIIDNNDFSNSDSNLGVDMNLTSTLSQAVADRAEDVRGKSPSIAAEAAETVEVTDETPDYDLTQLAAVGNLEAFEMLYKKYHRRAYSLCLRMTNSVAEAEDLTQEAFIQLFRKVGSFRGDSAFTTWFHRLTVNQVLMHFRKRSVKNEKTTEDGEMPEKAINQDRNYKAQMPILNRMDLKKSGRDASAWLPFCFCSS